MPRSSRRFEKEIAALAQRDLAYRELGEAIHDLMQRALGYDLGFWASLDPSSLLPTMFVPKVPESMLLSTAERIAKYDPTGLVASVKGAVGSLVHLEMMRKFMKYEFEYDDAMSPWNVPRAVGHVVSLSTCVANGSDVSKRVANAPTIGPNPRDELRVALMDSSECWGLLVLARMNSTFDRDEMSLASELSALLGRASRHAFLRAAARGEGRLNDAPGLLLLDSEGGVAHVSPEAQALLGDVPAAGWGWLASLEPAAERGGLDRIVVQTEHGPVTAHPTRLGDARAVIVERARTFILADLLVRAFGLTPRERGIVQGMSQGWSTRRIAFELDMADNTVQDHLKSVFDKIGVRSRKEVLAKLFFEHYVPQHRREAQPSPYGWFLPDND